MNPIPQGFLDMGYLRTGQYGRNRQRSPATYRDTAEPSIGIGIVKWFNPTKGFGFIVPTDGSADVFVHVSAVQRSGLNSLEEGQRVQFELVRGRNGKTAAENLRVL